MDITVMISHVFISFAAVAIYDLSYIHLHFSPPKGVLRKNTERILIHIRQIHYKINSLIQKLKKKKKIERTRPLTDLE